MRTAALLVALALTACHKRQPEACVPPEVPQPTECCESCQPEDVGCGVLVCKPDSGVNCAPCPRFE
jgi:hypothetical protein